MRGVWVGALFAVLLATGCSAVGLGDVALPRCENDEQCAPANRRFDIRMGACSLYQCNETLGFCEFRQARDDDDDGDPAMRCGGRDCDDDNALRAGDPVIGAEQCDGVDNDCDLVVDEEATVTRAAATVVTGVFGGQAVALARSSLERAAIVATGTTSGWFATLGAAPTSAMALPYAQDRDSRPDPWWDDAGLAPGCEGSACSLAQTAFAATGREGEWLTVAVTTASCSAGAIRIGRVGTANSMLEVRGPAARSNVYAGFDLAGDCNGAARASGTVGATRPAVAATLAPSGVPQGFAAWIGDGTSRASCGGSPAPVEGLAAWVESGTVSGATISYVSASNDAEPLVLGTTTGGGAPSVAALRDGSGFVVAFGSPEGVALRRVPLVAEPTPVATSPRPPEEVARPTANATVIDEGFVAEAGADHVALAEASVGRLGVAWRTGCGTASGRVRFATVAVDGFSPSSAVDLATGTIDAGPAVLTVESLVLAGFVSEGGATFPADAGGWVVLWVSGDRLFVRRVLEDGTIIDATARQIASGVAPASFAAVSASTDRTEPALVTYIAGDALMGVPVCGTSLPAM